MLEFFKDGINSDGTKCFTDASYAILYTWFALVFTSCNHNSIIEVDIMLYTTMQPYFASVSRLIGITSKNISNTCSRY